MKFKLKNNSEILSALLGDIDLIDIKYYLQQTSTSGVGVSGTSNLLLSLNSELLEILYKFDQLSSDYETDLTETGENICKNMKMKFITSNILKFELNYDFVRTFSFTKSSIESSSNSETSTNYISIDSSMLLDYESTELKTVLSETERKKVVNSKLLGVTIKDSNLTAKSSTGASRCSRLPSNVKYFSITNSKLSYDTETTTITDSDGNNVEIDIYVDSDISSDSYQKNNKSFAVIDDSTINLNFLIYIELDKNTYLIDKNDININYHIDPDGDNLVAVSGSNYTLSLYENINENILPVDKIVYIKNIYDDQIVAIGSIVDIDTDNNKLHINSLYTLGGNTITINNMDEFVLLKTYDLANYNLIQQNILFNELVTNDMLIFDEIIFENSDYNLKNSIS